MIKKTKILVLGFFPLLIFLTGCFDDPKEFYGPSWDVELNVPLTEKTYTLKDAIEKDTSMIKWYQNTGDPNKEGQLYYSDQQSFERITVGDNLNIDDFNTRFTRKIGPIRINDVEPIETGIQVSDWSDVQAGETREFPESEGEVEIGFNRIDAFNSVTLQSGNLLIEVENRLPVPIELRGVQIVNARSGTTVAERNENITIDSLETTTLNFDLEGEIQDSLEYQGTIYSPGSGNETVVIPTEAGTQITATFENLVISRAEAPLPEQDPITLDSTFAVDDSTEISEATIQSGNFSLTFNNYMDITLDVDLTLNALKRDDGSTYSRQVTLQRNEKNKVVQITEMGGWSIDPAADLTNELNYSVQVNSRSTEEARTISRNDSLTTSINFSEIVLQSMSGRIEPTDFQMEKSSFGFDLGDIEGNFTYENLNFDNPNVLLRLVSSAGVGFKLNGDLTAANDQMTQQIQLDINVPKSGTQTVVNLNDYGFKGMLNSFSGSFPDTFNIAGNTVVNPDYEIGSVSRNDSVSGNIDIEIPMNIGIKGGVLSDTFDVDLGDDRQDILDAIDSTGENGGELLEASLTLDITNKIPTQISLSGAVLDTLTYNELVQFPPQYNDISEVSVTAPEVDDQGNVVSASETSQEIVLRGEDAAKFVKNPKLLLKLNLATPTSNNQLNPVKFRITDEISVRVFGTVNYTVDTESN